MQQVYGTRAPQRNPDDAKAIRPSVNGGLPEAPTLLGVTRSQWSAFLAAFVGWLLDGFDFSILTFLLIDIQHSFRVDRALAGALGTVTLIFRLAGGLGAGTAADRFGRKGPLILSIVWISLFSLLSGLSTSYAILFGCRALFGIGMGGVWASGLPLVVEHWPKNLRGVVSGLLMGGFNWGYMLAAAIFEWVYPLVNGRSYAGWRVLFGLAALPVFVVFWIHAKVKESPVWLNHRSELDQAEQKKLSVLSIFQHGLLRTTIQTSIVMSAFMFSYYSISFWYPTLLRQSRLAPLQFLVTFSAGAVAGTALWGRVSETRLGRRGAISLAAFLGILSIPLFVGVHHSWLLFGALFMGASGLGAWGIAPSYLTESFPTAARAVGPGFSYHAGAAIGSLTPTFIGMLQDRGISLPRAMGASIAIAGLLVVITIWMGPETRGRSFLDSGQP
jgi:MFS transporter, SHS family, lactate transporter